MARRDGLLRLPHAPEHVGAAYCNWRRIPLLGPHHVLGHRRRNDPCRPAESADSNARMARDVGAVGEAYRDSSGRDNERAR